MAILVRNSIEIVNAYLSTVVFLYDKYGNEKKVYWDDGSNIIQHYQYILRGMISLEIRIQGGQSFYINNVHLPSGRTNFACAVGIRLFASYHMLNNLFYTVGDFNVNPNYWNLPRSLTIKDPNRETHTGGGTLDYMVTNYPGIIRLSVIGNNYDSDHYPVIFDV